ncbi:MAG: hypothetical protein ACYC1C_21495, partial [Chloroflexota bacterium]
MSLSQPARGADWVPLALLVSYVLLAGTYFVVRSSGHWAETDSAQMALAIRSVGDSGTLVPAEGKVYPSGFGYAVVSNAILAFTGLSVAALQQVLYPLLSTLLVFPAWALYRELTGSRWAAALATFFLLSQPEFLFVVFRGSHERVTRALMIVCLWLLVRSFRLREQPRQFAVHVCLFYVMAFALMATNALFGMSFVLAIVIALLSAWTVGGIRPDALPLSDLTTKRLLFVATTTAGLGFVFIFYVYPPATESLQAINGVFQKLATLFLTTSSGANPYAQVAAGWTSLSAYLVVAASDYLLVLASAVIWLWLGLRWLRGRGDVPSTANWLLWLFYGAFAFQGALAVLSDRSGLMAANLQHRSFPSFAMVAAAMVGLALSRRPPRAWESVAVGSAFALLAVLALVKATNEPIVSNKWTF